MQEEFFKKVKKDLSAERLEAYGKKDQPNECTLFARYLWNIAVCQSLYSLLQNIEIALRNQIHIQLSSKYGNKWYDDAPLSKLQSKNIESAKESLKKTNKTVYAGAIVAELNFGFWTAFFNKENEKLGLSSMAAKAFKHAPKSQRTIQELSRRLNRIRRLRNRVFHHERIIHWHDLANQHAHILETIAWLSPEMTEMSQALDSFTRVHSAGTEPWKEKVRHHWPKITKRSE